MEYHPRLGTGPGQTSGEAVDAPLSEPTHTLVVCVPSLLEGRNDNPLVSLARLPKRIDSRDTSGSFLASWTNETGEQRRLGLVFGFVGNSWREVLGRWSYALPPLPLCSFY